MNLLVPAALAFGAIIPVILLLYFMRPKRQERIIGSTFLWQQALQDMQASRPWQRLRITPLLLIQLLAALIIVFVLTRPAIFASSSVSGNTIIILQASASMQATDIAPNRFEEARNQIDDLIDGIGTNDHLSLISMAHTPQVLIAQSQDKGRLKAALRGATLTNQDADLEQALSLASSLAAGQANAQVLIVGDGHISHADQNFTFSFPVRYLKIGKDTPNNAILALSARNTQGKLIAFAQIANYSHKQQAIPVELYADGNLVGVQTATLPADTTGTVQWQLGQNSPRTLHARLVTQDALSLDNEAWSTVGSSIRGRVLLVTKGNSFLKAALRLQSNVDLYEVTPDKYSPTAASFDLTVFDTFTPTKLPDGAILFVNPPNGIYLFGQVNPEVKISRLTAGNDTLNLLTDVDLASIHTLSASHPLKPELWAQSIITAPETPLLLAGETNNRRVATFGFDLHNTDLPLQPAFPILMHNLINWFLPPPVNANKQLIPGAPITLQSWPGAEKVTVTAPDKVDTVVGPPFPIVPFARTNQTGLYQVMQKVHGQDLRGAFAINLFDPTQSRLNPAQKLPIARSSDFGATGNTVSRQLREIWPWIAGILLVVLSLEWWLFSRGYRQRAAPSQSGQGPQSPLLARQNGAQRLLTRLQNDLQERYRFTKKRWQKMRKGMKNRQLAKGDRHVNV